MSELIVIDKEKVFKKFNKKVIKIDDLLRMVLINRTNKKHKKKCDYKCCGMHDFTKYKKCTKCGMSERTQKIHDIIWWDEMSYIYENDPDVDSLREIIEDEQDKTWKTIKDKRIYESNYDLCYGD